NETGETLLRDAFSGIGLELEEFPDENRLVENLTRHKNALGLANNYGVVFLRAGDGVLSYVLRFPSWQEFYTRETRTTSDSERMPQYWLYGILLPLVAGINMAQARREALSTGRRLPSVSFKTRRFPTPSSSPSGGGRSVRRLIDLCVVYGFIVIAPVAVKRIADEKSVGMKDRLEAENTELMARIVKLEAALERERSERQTVDEKLAEANEKLADLEVVLLPSDITANGTVVERDGGRTYKEALKP
ncbi:hypothetical protein HPB47_023818, partial [Ixodes persulcatus]